MSKVSVSLIKSLPSIFISFHSLALSKGFPLQFKFMFSDCDIEGYGELNYNNYGGFYLLPGLNCTTTIYVHAHIWLENPNYEYTWSDWAYYIAWTETEVTMED